MSFYIGSLPELVTPILSNYLGFEMLELYKKKTPIEQLNDDMFYESNESIGTFEAADRSAFAHVRITFSNDNQSKYKSEKINIALKNLRLYYR